MLVETDKVLPQDVELYVEHVLVSGDWEVVELRSGVVFVRRRDRRRKSATCITHLRTTWFARRDRQRELFGYKSRQGLAVF